MEADLLTGIWVSSQETEDAHDPYSTADAPPVRSKRPVSFSSDEEQNAGKRARHE